MGLIDPQGPTARATLALLDRELKTSAGPGWIRNDDFRDWSGAHDHSPWGSTYDAVEWAICNLRGAVATHLMDDGARRDRLIDWTTQQALRNYLQVAETWDADTGVYRFNAPMMGFGAGAWLAAVAVREGRDLVGPACGAYLDESLRPPEALDPDPDVPSDVSPTDPHVPPGNFTYWRPTAPTVDDPITVYSPAPGMLHWAVNGWQRADVAYWPPGTIPVAGMPAVDTRMVGPNRHGFYAITIGPFSDGTVQVVDFVIATDTGAWDNNGGRDYHINVLPRSVVEEAQVEVAEDAVEMDAEPPASKRGDDGCGCRVAAGAPPAWPLWVAGLMLGCLGLLWRRRR